MQKLVRCFLDVDLRGQHLNLIKVAKSQRVSLEHIKRGEHIIFINRKRDKIKMYSVGGVLSYLKLRPGQSIDLETLKMIPEAFTTGNLELAYDKSLKSLIKKGN